MSEYEKNERISLVSFIGVLIERYIHVEVEKKQKKKFNIINMKGEGAPRSSLVWTSHSS